MVRKDCVHHRLDPRDTRNWRAHTQSENAENCQMRQFEGTENKKIMRAQNSSSGVGWNMADCNRRKGCGIIRFCGWSKAGKKYNPNPDFVAVIPKQVNLQQIRRNLWMDSLSFPSKPRLSVRCFGAQNVVLQFQRQVRAGETCLSLHGVAELSPTQTKCLSFLSLNNIKIQDLTIFEVCDKSGANRIFLTPVWGCERKKQSFVVARPIWIWKGGQWLRVGKWWPYKECGGMFRCDASEGARPLCMHAWRQITHLIRSVLRP